MDRNINIYNKQSCHAFSKWYDVILMLMFYQNLHPSKYMKHNKQWNCNKYIYWSDTPPPDKAAQIPTSTITGQAHPLIKP